jgi:hypothetical protein
MNMKTKKQSSFAGIAAAAVIITTLALTLSLTACPEPVSNNSNGGDEGPLPTPAAKRITWTTDGGSKSYELAITEISSSKSTYVLSYTASPTTYNVGTVTISGNTYTFTADSTVMQGSNSFTLTIDGTTLSTSGAQTIKLINDDRTPASPSSIAPTFTSITVTINVITGGGETNNFVGTWRGSNVKAFVYPNLTRRATASDGYRNDGTYAFIGNRALIIDSRGMLFGYASVSGNSMPTFTADGGDITFTK